MNKNKLFKKKKEKEEEENCCGTDGQTDGRVEIEGSTRGPRGPKSYLYSEQKAPQLEDRLGCHQGSEFLMIIVARTLGVVMKWFVDINKPLVIMVTMMMMIL